MNEEERSWTDDKRENFDEWKARLKRTALALPEEKVRSAMGSMKRRTVQVDASKGLWVKND